jgi:putative transcriptional regulator
MTQEELAVQVGVTRQTIIAIESGKYTPSLGLAFRIARTFNRGIEEIFKLEDDQRRKKRTPNAQHRTPNAEL